MDAVTTDALRGLDEALADPGFWRSYGEEERTVAEHFAGALDDAGWTALDEFWRERPVDWQRCLATVLVAVGPPHAVAWLLEMIEEGADDLAIHAIDELRELHRSSDLTLPWPDEALARVRQLWSQRRGFTPRQLEQLIDDMARGRLGR